MWSKVAEKIADQTNMPFELARDESLSGGCINDARKLIGSCGTSYFAKSNSTDFLKLFQAEACALDEIYETNTIRVPKSICSGTEANRSFLVLEFIESGSGSAESQRKMGSALASLHLIKKNHFGWIRDNAIGATPQPNPNSDDWPSFYRDYRLRHQLNLAEKRGRSFQGSEALLEKVPQFFNEYKPFPSILHGDLWGGNASCDTSGTPFVFDPATYYGDRETDLAFTYMFGGFSKEFHEAYNAKFPLDAGFKIRKTLYNLYHELNHFNLFGGGYAASAQASIDHLLSSSK